MHFVVCPFVLFLSGIVVLRLNYSSDYLFGTFKLTSHNNCLQSMSHYYKVSRFIQKSMWQNISFEFDIVIFNIYTKLPKKKWRRSILSKEIRHTEFKISTEISSSWRTSCENRFTRLFGMMIIWNFQLTNIKTVQSCFKELPHQVPIPSHMWFMGRFLRFQRIKKC